MDVPLQSKTGWEQVALTKLVLVDASVDVVLEDETHIAWVALQLRGTEWARCLQAVGAMWDWNRCPVPASQQREHRDAEALSSQFPSLLSLAALNCSFLHRAATKALSLP